MNDLNWEDNDFGTLKTNFVMHASGVLNIPKTINVVFRLVCDDGGRLFIDDKLVVDNGVNHCLKPTYRYIILNSGKHSFRL